MEIKVKYKFYVDINEFPILRFYFTYYGRWFYRNMNLKNDDDINKQELKCIADCWRDEWRD